MKWKLNSFRARRKKRALITGITGQDGSYLAELLLAQNYEVTGTIRFLKQEKLWRLSHILPQIRLLETDLIQRDEVRDMVRTGFDEIYHLAGPSFIPFCWERPLEISEAMLGSTASLLEALADGAESTRFCHASSAAIFGNPAEVPQNEETPLQPINPYGEAKKEAHRLVLKFRERGLFACNAIMFNHESPRRDLKFAVHKITDAAARIKLGAIDKKIPIGNLHTKRDWGFAGDYVEALWLMLQAKSASDYVIATNRSYMVRDLIEITFATIGIGNWKDYIEVDPALIRRQEIEHLRGDYSRAKRRLNWEPKHSFSGLISMMIAEDMKRIKKEMIGAGNLISEM
ncbi:MAG: GDP-mannose 4,6-dehydratase [Acidobacteriota bacterium]